MLAEWPPRLAALHLFQPYEDPADAFLAPSYRQARKHMIDFVESLYYLPLSLGKTASQLLHMVDSVESLYCLPLSLGKTASQVLGLVGISYPGGRRWIGTKGKKGQK